MRGWKGGVSPPALRPRGRPQAQFERLCAARGRMRGEVVQAPRGKETARRRRGVLLKRELGPALLRAGFHSPVPRYC